jgi:predicted dehydrogenase
VEDGLLWPGAGLGLGYGDAFLLALGDAVAAVAAGRPASPDFADGLRACEIVDAAQRSAASGAWVSP